MSLRIQDMIYSVLSQVGGGRAPQRYHQGEPGDIIPPSPKYKKFLKNLKNFKN
jgi:hypothetical protein